MFEDDADKENFWHATFGFLFSSVLNGIRYVIRLEVWLENGILYSFQCERFDELFLFFAENLEFFFLFIIINNVKIGIWILNVNFV